MTLVGQITVDADATQVTFSALNGDTDRIYQLECIWIPPATAGVLLSLAPNAQTSGQLGNVSWAPASTLSYAAPASLAIARTISTGGKTIFVQTTLYAKSGVPRVHTSIEAASEAAPDTSITSLNAGIWSNTSDEITSIDIIASAANAIKAGSLFRLYRR